MGKESISRKTFVKGLAAGVLLAASLGTLQTGDYVIRSNGSMNAGAAENSPADAQPETASSAAINFDKTPGTESETEVLITEAEKETETLSAEIESETEAFTSKSKDAAGKTESEETKDSETEKKETK